MSLEDVFARIQRRQRDLAHMWVGAALDILAKHLAPFAEERYRVVYGERHKEKMAEVLRQEGDQEGRIDAGRALDLLLYRWKELGLEDAAGSKARTYLYELKEARNRWAHQEPFEAWEARRTLETAALLLRSISSRKGVGELLPYLGEALAEERFWGLFQVLRDFAAVEASAFVPRAEDLLKEVYRRIAEAERIDGTLVETVLRAQRELPPAGQRLLFAALEISAQGKPGYEVYSVIHIQDSAGLADLILDALGEGIPATDEGIGWLLYAAETFSEGKLTFEALKEHGWDWENLWPYRRLAPSRF